MTLEQFKRFIDALNKYHEREDELSKSIEPFNTSYTVIEFCPDIVKSIVTYIEEVFEDTNEWFKYWYYELEQGRNKKLGASYKDGTPIKLESVEDIYEFMRFNKK